MKDKQPGTYYYRIRAYYGEIVSEWCGWDHILVPEPEKAPVPETAAVPEPAVCFITTAAGLLPGFIPSIPDKNVQIESLSETESQKKQVQRLLRQLKQNIKDINNGKIKDYEFEAQWEETAKVLFQYGETAEDALIIALEDSAMQVRGFAAYTLGQMQSKKSVPSLINTLKDKSWQVRRLTAEALGIIDDQRTKYRQATHSLE